MRVPLSNCDWMMYLLKVPKFSKINLYPKRKGLLFCTLIFAFCVKILNSQQLKKYCLFVNALEGIKKKSL